MALAAVDPSGTKAIHCSFDIDALDALDVPSTGTPGLFLIAIDFFILSYINFPYNQILVPGGLTLREGSYIMEELHRTGRLEAVDLVEVNPNFGNSNDLKKTVDAGIHILKASCGNLRSGNLPKQIKDIPIHFK